MNLKALLRIVALLLTASAVHADPPISLLTAVRLHLTTSTLHFEKEYTSSTVDGITHRRVSRKPFDISLPGNVVDGYVQRTNFDPPLAVSTNTKPADLAVNGQVFFYLESELVKIKHPRPALITTNLQYVFLPISVVEKVEKRAGPHDGYSAYGEPFYMPAWQAKLLSTKEPIAVCTPDSERRELDWVSYNELVGEKELNHICDPVVSGPPTLQSLLEKGNVFGVVYPAD